MDFTLRPMSTSEVLDRMFNLYRNNFVLFAGIAALPAIMGLIINLLQVSSGVVRPRLGALPQFSSGAVLGGLVVGVALLVVYVMAAGATVYGVSVVHLGKTTTIGDSYKNIQGRLWTLIKIGLLLFVGFFGIAMAIAIPFALAFVVPPLALLGIPMLIVGLVLLVHLYARVSFSTAICVLENAGAVQSIRRSLALTKGRSGRIWLVLLLTIILNWVLAFAIVSPITLATAATGSIILTQIGASIGQFLAGVLASPILAISLVLLYYDERVRKEAFDLQYMMAVLDQSGQHQTAAAGQ